MRLSAPKQATWWVALVIGVVGILAHLVTIPVLSGFAFWLVVVAFVLLLVASFSWVVVGSLGRGLTSWWSAPLGMWPALYTRSAFRCET